MIRLCPQGGFHGITPLTHVTVSINLNEMQVATEADIIRKNMFIQFWQNFGCIKQVLTYFNCFVPDRIQGF